MIANQASIETLIKEYIAYREKSLHYSRKKTDSEKEYNKLLIISNGGTRHYNLNEADKIYRCYCDMLKYDEESKQAETKFLEAEEKLKDLGRILFDATINAEITMPVLNGEIPELKTVTVTFNNGQVMVR